MGKGIVFTALALALGTAAHARTVVAVHAVVYAAPLPVIVVQPVRIAQQWVPGHWEWNGEGHVWMPGHWQLPPRAYGDND